jgi:hypothetical protein
MTASYSLWLAPDRESPEYERLAELIEEYARAHENSPAFDPHLTVAGNLSKDKSEILSVGEQLVEEHYPIDVSLERPYCSTTKFQCVFLLAEPSTALLELQQDATELLGSEPGMYVPHLSLIYSTMDLAERRELVDSLGEEGLGMTFTASELQVAETGGPVPDWHVAETIRC